VVVLDVQGFPLQSQWHVVHHKGKQLSPIAQIFRDHLLRSSKLWR
jgi:DNA-binding transcriptional LysR family regulator